MTAPDVRYVRNDGASIAYTRWGAGDEIVVFTPPMISNVELAWDLPEYRRTMQWAGRHHQVVMIDKRGVGLSDRTLGAADFRQRADDTLAVMDQEEIASAHIMGFSEGALLAAVIAAEHPERVDSLSLIGAIAQVTRSGAADDPTAAFVRPGDPPYPDYTRLASLLRDLIRHWGTSESVMLDHWAPSAAGEERLRRWWVRFERQSASPSTLRESMREDYPPLQPFLDRVTAPIMIGHSAGDRSPSHVAHGRHLAAMNPTATYIEWPTDDHFWMLSPVVRDIQNDMIEFVTGSRPGRGSTTAFATVLFTDIVDSTARARELGDHGWAEFVQLHDGISRQRVEEHGGTIVKGTGDGVLATFPDPLAAVHAATRMRDDLAGAGVPIRAGVHTGQIELRDDGDVAGLAVNIASRVEGHAGSGEIVVSQTVRDVLLGAVGDFEPRGRHRLKGVDGEWSLYALTPTAS